MAKTNEKYFEALLDVQAELRAFIAAALPFHSPDVNDLCQEINAELVRCAAKFDASRPFRPWFWQVARNQLALFRRKRANDRLIFPEETLESLAERMQCFCEDTSVSKTLLSSLSQCESKLSERHRRLLDLRYRKGLHNTEIAKLFGTTAHSIDSTISRLRKRLYRCIVGKCVMPGEDIAATSLPYLSALFDSSPLSSAEKAELIAAIVKSPEEWAEEAFTEHLLRYDRALALKHKPRRRPLVLGLFAMSAAAGTLLLWPKTQQTQVEEIAPVVVAAGETHTETPIMNKTIAAPAAILLVSAAASAAIEWPESSATSETLALDTTAVVQQTAPAATLDSTALASAEFGPISLNTHKPTGTVIVLLGN